jgi:hypothetical protein
VFSRTMIWLKSFAVIALALLAAAPARAATSTQVPVPLGQIAGMTAAGPADTRALLRIAIEYEPKADLDTLAGAMTDPASPAHRQPLTADAFSARFGRDGRDGDALAAFLRANGVTDIFISRNRLVGGGIIDVGHAQRAFSVHFERYTAGSRAAIAPSGPLTVPLPNIRAVHGVVAATTPRLADVPSFTLFRGDWYTPEKLREAYDAIPNGGGNERISIVEDASDRFDLRDIAPFLSNDGAPPGATAARVIERSFAFKASASQCGRDDRGQEPALDADAALTMAPLATVVYHPPKGQGRASAAQTSAKPPSSPSRPRSPADTLRRRLATICSRPRPAPPPDFPAGLRSICAPLKPNCSLQKRGRLEDVKPLHRGPLVDDHYSCDDTSVGKARYRVAGQYVNATSNRGPSCVCFGRAYHRHPCARRVREIYGRTAVYRNSR